MEAVGEALTDFPTNRTGFVVLHPSEAAGGRLTIRHSDGSIEQTVFPEAISADQPAFDISALTHEPAPGVSCTVEMEGDAFEMEDQRNWADASFKTYIRPLSKPRPYTYRQGPKRSPADHGHDQGSSRSKAGRNGRGCQAHPRSAGRPDAVDGPVPRPGRAAVRAGACQRRSARHRTSSSASMPIAGMIGEPSCRPPTLPGRSARGWRSRRFSTLVDPRTEATRVVDAIRSANVEPSAVLVSPRREFKTRPSNMLPPGESGTDALVNALRAAGLKASIGAGTPSFFTEFNRNPPTGDGDFVFFSVASNVHAADDLSVMETLSVYPAVIASARKTVPGQAALARPLHDRHASQSVRRDCCRQS